MQSFRSLVRLGDEAFRLGDLTTAAKAFRTALEQRPQSVACRYNLATCLRDAGRTSEAMAHVQQILVAHSSSALVHHLHGELCELGGDYESAIVAYESAISLDAEYAASHLNLAMCLLRLGRYARGWAEFEWRWKTGCARPELGIPVWDGAMTAGTLLVYAEEGLGDTLQFARFLPEAARRAHRLVAVVPHPLIALFRRWFPQIAVVDPRDAGPTIRVDAHISIMSLPRVLGVELTCLNRYGIPSSIQPKRGSRRKLRVGINWSGNPRHPRDVARSCPLPILLDIASVKGLELFSVQHRPHDADQKLLDAHIDSISDLGPMLGDFATTADLLASLDVVVTVDTAMAHLAGTTGLATYVLLAQPCDWRWSCDTNETPWYPSVRLFRQRSPGHWGEVVDELKVALAGAVAQHCISQVG